jgi:uncharacterized damage-inducible protein DinB
MDTSSLSNKDLITAYQDAARELVDAVADLTPEELRKRIAPGKWSVQEVVCHIADFEIINAERIRRVLAEDEPTLFNGEPDDFERTLFYEKREVTEELALIQTIRNQTALILRNIPDEAWQRRGIHSTDGPLTLRQLIERVCKHIPHHVAFIRDKRAALRAGK